jgi:4-amino-4-deoxy-L-arabinose transferase-like glycosyltransferase
VTTAAETAGAPNAGGAPPTGARVDRRLVLLGIVALAAAVRLVGLGDRLSDAEGYSWLVASAPGWDAFFDRLAAYENTPPLFYALLAPLPHGDEAWLRVPALLPAVACVPVAYCLVRPLLGTRVALLTALAVAVAPFHVSYSNYSRGFMLAALGLLLAAWAVARLAEGRRARWWWLYLGGATLALQSEYDALLFLAPLLGLPALWRRSGWRTVVALGALPLLTLLPLAGELLRGLDQLDVTKLTPPSAELSPASLRDSLVSLFAGTHGLAGSSALRALQLIALLGALAVAATWLWRRWGRLARLDGTRRDVAFWLLAVVPATAVVLHAAASVPGPEIFDSRYLVGLIPFACALLAAGVEAVPWRGAVPAAALCLLALAAAVVVQRHDRELQPDVAPAAELVAASGARTVLTNSPVAAYYLTGGDAHAADGVAVAGTTAGGAVVRLDRPFGLGNAEPGCTPPACPRPLAVVEDARLPGGVRAGPGQATPVGPIVVRITP